MCENDAKKETFFDNNLAQYFIIISYDIELFQRFALQGYLQYIRSNRISQLVFAFEWVFS